MPARFAFWGADLWMPAHLDRKQPADWNRYFVLYGHLKPGLDPKGAESDVRILAQRVVENLSAGLPEEVRRASRIPGVHRDRKVREHAVYAARGGQPAAADCVRKRSKSAAGEGHGAGKGAGNSDIG